MPNQDGTGPLGRGRLTGKGFEPCGRGFKRGFGFRRYRNVELTKEEEKKILQEELKDLEAEKKEIENALKDLK